MPIMKLKVKNYTTTHFYRYNSLALNFYLIGMLILLYNNENADLCHSFKIKYPLKYGK